MEPRPITTDQRIRFAILAARKAGASRAWHAWSNAWWIRRDRTPESALAAENEAASAALRDSSCSWAASRAAAAARVAAEGPLWASTQRLTLAEHWADEAILTAARDCAAAGRPLDLLELARRALEF